VEWTREKEEDHTARMSLLRKNAFPVWIVGKNVQAERFIYGVVDRCGNSTRKRQLHMKTYIGAAFSFYLCLAVQ
jgi:hypothetical protein